MQEHKEARKGALVPPLGSLQISGMSFRCTNLVHEFKDGDCLAGVIPGYRHFELDAIAMR
jgi:hypothetical protein